ncbi:fibronectin type III domain-containing protein [Streptomyces sp. NPDC006476]|uniref:fibronectin type III domain-containing protein n=1 Tax=Streptomyces sp. NPDC006476 TaxID=3157175 RepID=UPI0033ABAA28
MGMSDNATGTTGTHILLARPSTHQQWLGGGAWQLTVYNLTGEDRSIGKIEFEVSTQKVSNHTGGHVHQDSQHVTVALEEHKRKIPAHSSTWVRIGVAGPVLPHPHGFQVDGTPADVPVYDAPPNKPANLRVTRQSGRSVRLKWDPSTDEVAVIGYEVTLVGRPGVIEVVEPSAIIGHLEPEADYQAQVVAVNIAGRRSETTSLSFNSGKASGERPAWDIPVMPFIDYAGTNTVGGGNPKINAITPIAEATGVRGASLGFITVANADMEPCWGSVKGYDAINGKHNREDVIAFKKLAPLSGRPVISLGGWINHIPEYVVKDVEKVVGWYSAILDAYGIDRVDFDIEGAAQNNPQFIERHISIVYKLLEARPSLRVSYTLPVDAGGERRPVEVESPDDPHCPSDLVAGFNVYGKAFIQQLAEAGISPSLFNGMTMAMGNHDRPQGKEAIIALRFMHRDVKKAFPHLTDAQVWARLGACPMFGINDGGEFFKLDDMRRLIAFAKTVRLGCISGWDAQRDWNSNRDATGCKIGEGEIFKCTRADQQPGDYLKIAATYQEW